MECRLEKDLEPSFWFIKRREKPAEEEIWKFLRVKVTERGEHGVRLLGCGGAGEPCPGERYSNPEKSTFCWV